MRRDKEYDGGVHNQFSANQLRVHLFLLLIRTLNRWRQNSSKTTTCLSSASEKIHSINTRHCYRRLWSDVCLDY